MNGYEKLQGQQAPEQYKHTRVLIFFRPKIMSSLLGIKTWGGLYMACMYLCVCILVCACVMCICYVHVSFFSLPGNCFGCINLVEKQCHPVVLKKTVL